MSKSLLAVTSDIVWIQILMLFIGISLIIIAFFKQKDDTVNPNLEKILDDFSTQMNIENEDIFKRIKKSEENIAKSYEERIKLLENKVEQLEQLEQNVKEEHKNSTQIFNRYEQVIELHQAGDSLEKIAEKTKLGYAEIKLIIDLSKKGLKYV